MTLKRHYLSFDVLLVLLVCGIVIFGIIIIGSATHITENGPSREYTVQKLWFVIGLCLLLASAFVDYHFIAKFYIAIYIFNLLLLTAVLVLVKNTGDGVSRWISFGGVGIQPSEFAKVFMLLYLSKFIDKNNEKINNIFVILIFLITISIPVYLIKIQPSLSASLIIVSIAAIILYVGGISYKYIAVALILIGILSVLLYFDITSEKPVIINKILADYQLKRINPDPNSWDYYQTNNSIRAIASGQLFGKGLYKGTVNQLSYLPENHNDFIFSVIGEEFGFAGAAAVIGVVLVIIGKCILIAKNSPDILGKLIASSVAGMLFFQAFANIGVAIGLLPNTGMPFPFLSSGGSSMCTNMIAVGLVINVGMSKPKSFFER